jgi:hypothetical protein
VAIYEPADGRVVHMHHVVICEGGKSISPQQAESEAVEQARRRGHDTARLETLLVRDHPERHRGRFRVDLASKTLVLLDPPVRPQIS